MSDFHPLAGKDDPRIVEFLEAWHANGRDTFTRSYPSLDYDSYEPKCAHNHRKYIYLDRGSSGVFMVTKATGEVWGIRAYGKIHHGRFIGHLEEITRQFGLVKVN